MLPRFHTVRGIPIVLEPDSTRVQTFDITLGPITIGELHDDGNFIARVWQEDCDITTTGLDVDRRIQLALEELVDKLFELSKFKANQFGLLAVPVLPGFGCGKGAV